MTKTTYTEMVDSGIEWIGKIPKEWEVRKLRTIGNFSASGIDKKYDENEELVKMVNYTDVYGNVSKKITNEIDFMNTTCSKDKSTEHLIKKGDLIFTPSSETKVDIGLSCLVDEDIDKLVYSYHVLRFRFKLHFDHEFKKYLCNNEIVLNQFSKSSKGTTRQILNRNHFNNTIVFIPPLTTQQAIASYLDDKTAQIEQAITLKTQQIELLREKRSALINHVVTKGLDPDVELVDSGIEWIGKIPKGWEVRKLKYCLDDMVDNRGRTPEVQGEGKPMLEVNGISDSKYPDPSKITKYLSEENYKDFVRKDLQVGDVLFVTVGATIGKSCIIPKDFDYCILQNIVGFRFNSSIIDSRLFLYISYSEGFKEFYKLRNKANTLDSIKVSIFVNEILPVPPIKYQKEICDYLDTETAQIDNTISLIQQSIDLLIEYKQSLISHVVTGKVKVG